MARDVRQSGPRDVRQSLPRDLDKAALHATLDVMLRVLAQPKPVASRGAAPAAGPVAAEPPRDALLAAYEGAKRSMREAVMRDPFDSTMSVVGVGTLLFYLAEKDKNEKCKTIWDALAFITTCLSVGYDDLFAKTSAGKAIASFVMTVGPQLSGIMFDPPKRELEREAAQAAADQAAAQRAIVERLDAIVEALRDARPQASKGGESSPSGLTPGS